jgi:hypothetical protein
LSVDFVADHCQCAPIEKAKIACPCRFANMFASAQYVLHAMQGNSQFGGNPAGRQKYWNCRDDGEPSSALLHW